MKRTTVRFIIRYYALLFIIIFLCISFFFLDFFLEILQLEKKKPIITTRPACHVAISASTRRLSRGFGQPGRVKWALPHISPATQTSGLSLGSSPCLSSSSIFLCIPFRLLPLLSCPEEKPMDRYNKVTSVFQLRKLRLLMLGAAPGCPAGR